MNWLYLALAIALDMCGVACMRLSAGFTRPLASALVFACYAIGLVCMILAVRSIPIGVAYAIWAGMGTVLVALIGWWAFHEPMSGLRIACIALVVLGVVGLKLTTPATLSQLESSQFVPRDDASRIARE